MYYIKVRTFSKKDEIMDVDPGTTITYQDQITAIAKRAGDAGESRAFAAAAAHTLQAMMSTRRDIPYGEHLELLMRAVIATVEDDEPARSYIQEKLDLGYHGLRNALGIVTTGE